MLGSLTLVHLKPAFYAFTANCHNLNQAVKEAEKVVGYSASYSNIQSSFSDEIARVSEQIKKLDKTDHPFVHASRTMFMGTTTLPNWSLIVLLLSKAAGVNDIQMESEKDHTTGVLNSQHQVAEITDLMCFSQKLHRSIVHVDHNDCSKELKLANKLAVVSGDRLLASCFQKLANLRNHRLQLLFSTALRDLTEFTFLDDKPHKPVSTEPVILHNNFHSDLYSCKAVFGNPRAEWIYRNTLKGASLLGKACQSTLNLAKHPEPAQETGYIFGKSFALAWHAQLERKPFESFPDDSSFSLVSVPVMLQLEYDADFYKLIIEQNVNYKELKRVINVGEGLLKAKALQYQFCNNALKALNKFPESDSRTALHNIIKTIT